MPWLLFLIFASGCASAFQAARREEGSAPNGRLTNNNTNLVDPCPKEDSCSCAEGTGWLPGTPQWIDDNYVEIGRRHINPKRELITVKETKYGERTRWMPIRTSSPFNLLRPKRNDGVSLVPLTESYKSGFEVTTYFPKIDFNFQLGSAEPANADKFENSARYLTSVLLKVILKKYPCVQSAFTSDFVVYVVGKTDRLGNDTANQRLSEARAQRVASSLTKWFSENRSKLLQPVHIEYIGMGESLAQEAGDPDNSDNPQQRAVDVTVLTTGRPFEGTWTRIATINPTGKK